MNIPSFKLRKTLSVKEKHYVIYGLLTKEDSVYDPIKNVVIVKSTPLIIESLIQLKIKFVEKEDILIINKIKTRFFEDKFYIGDRKVVTKYVFKRMHPVGILLLIENSIRDCDKMYIGLNHLDNSQKISLIERLQDFGIYSKLENNEIAINYKYYNRLVEISFYFLSDEFELIGIP